MTWLSLQYGLKHINCHEAWKRHITCVLQQHPPQKNKWNKKQINKYVIEIDGEITAEVISSNVLGVILNDTLNSKDRVSFVCRKVARGLGVIIKARKVLWNESLKILYYLYTLSWYIATRSGNMHVKQTTQNPYLFYKIGP